MDKSQTMRETPRQVLCELLAKYGDALIDEPGRCSGLLRDALSPDPRGPYKTEINLLLTAREEGVPAALRSRSLVGPMAMQLNRQVQRLRDDRQLNEDAARWAVETWALALGVISMADLSRPDENPEPPPADVQPAPPTSMLPVSAPSGRKNHAWLAAAVVGVLATAGIGIRWELDQLEQAQKTEAARAEQARRAEIEAAQLRADRAVLEAERAKWETEEARRKAERISKEADEQRRTQTELAARWQAESERDREVADSGSIRKTPVDEPRPSPEQLLSPESGFGGRPLTFAADWGNHIQAHATTKEQCLDADFSRQGYIHALLVTIPASRMKSETDAWAVINGRALTVVGCWFYKDDGLAHAKMKRKKDGKVWEQDLNFNDGSWREVAN